MYTEMVKAAARRTRRRHDPKFKAQVTGACLQPGVSVAGVALANGLNANYLRRRVKERREQTGMTNDWLMAQGLASIRSLWMVAHGHV